MPAEPTQHARYVATLVSIVASSIVGGGGAAIPAAWATWGLLKKRAEAAGRAGVEVVEEQSAVVRSLIRLSSMLRLFEDTLWLGNIREDLGSSAIVGKSLLQEDAVDAGTLTTEPVAHIDQIFVSLALCVNRDGLLNMLDCSTSATKHPCRRHCRRRRAFRWIPASC